MNQEMIELVARELAEAEERWFTSDTGNMSRREYEARAALKTTADHIESIYGELHPGVVCIRSALTSGQSK